MDILKMSKIEKGSSNPNSKKTINFFILKNNRIIEYFNYFREKERSGNGGGVTLPSLIGVWH